MNFSILKTILFKELVDTLRDKRTLIAMIGIPMVLYPLLFIVMSQVLMLQRSKVQETPSKVVVVAEEEELIISWLDGAEPIELVDNDAPDEALKRGEIDAILVAEGSIADRLDENDTVEVEIQFDVTTSSSREAEIRVTDAIADTRETLLEARLDTEGLTEAFAMPIRIERNNVSPPSKTTGMLLGLIVPVLMVTMLGVGAFYPAVDLTAGEKERGTFETLLSTPTSSLEIVFGKFFAVFILAMLTGLLNLGSMTVTLLFQLSQLSDFVRDQADTIDLELLSIPPQSIVAMVVVLIPLAFFISASMMTVAVFARSFKDAQNYVTPFFIVIILPAGVASIPEIELSAATQLIPIANVALLFRDLLMESAPLDMIFVVFLSTAIYALLALIVATWIFQREDVILSEERGLPLTFRRSEFRPTTNPTPGMALGIFAVVMLLFFYVGMYAQAKDIHLGLLITEFGVILLPLLAILWFARVDIKDTLSLRMPSRGTAIASAVAAPACLLLVMQFAVWQNKVLPQPEGFEHLLEQLFGIGDSSWGLLALILLIGLSPAICEEALFRGVLLAGLRNKLPRWGTVLAVGLLFGAFHLSIYRFVPTATIGILLTYLVLRSGSIVPGVIGHFVSNSVSVLLATEHMPSGVMNYIKDESFEQTGFPDWTIAVAAITLLATLVLVEFTERRKMSGQVSAGP